MNSSQVVGRRQVLLGEDVPIIIQPDGIGAEDRHPIKLAVDLARAEGGLRQCRGIQQPGKIGRMSRQRRRAHIWSGVQRDDVWRLAGGERRVHPRHIGRTRHLGQLDVNVGIRLLEPRQDRDHAVLPLRMVVPQGQGDLVLRAGRRERAMAASDAAMTERRRYRFIPVSLSRLRKQWRFSWQARRSRSIQDSMPKLPGLASLARWNSHCDILDIIEILQIGGSSVQRWDELSTDPVVLQQPDRRKDCPCRPNPLRSCKFHRQRERQRHVLPPLTAIPPSAWSASSAACRQQCQAR